MSPAWPKRWTPRQVIGLPRKASVCGWPSSSETIGTAGREEAASSVSGSPSPRPGAGLEGAEQQVGAGDADDLGVAEDLGGLERLGDERAHHGDRELRVVVRAAACSRPRSPPRASRCGSDWSIGRVREPEVGGGPAGLAELGQRVQEAPLEVLAEGGLVGDAAGLLDADAGRDHRLVRAALGAERDAGRRADEDRLAAGVDAERPRLQRAGHERVVDRADGQQRLAVARPGRAELAEQADEVDLGDPELDVAAVVVLAPAHERVGVVGEPVDAVADVQMPALLIQPPRLVEVPTSGLTVTTRSATSGRLAGEVDEEAPERLLGGGRAGVLAAEVVRDLRRR